MIDDEPTSRRPAYIPTPGSVAGGHVADPAMV